MFINLSIKNVPKEWVQHLRQRASQHHRSLQGELLSILKDSLDPAGQDFPTTSVGRITATGLTHSQGIGADREEKPRWP